MAQPGDVRFVNVVRGCQGDLVGHGAAADIAEWLKQIVRLNAGQLERHVNTIPRAGDDVGELIAAQQRDVALAHVPGHIRPEPLRC